MICNSTLTHVLDMVSSLAVLDHLINLIFDELHVLRHLLDHCKVLSSYCFALILGEQVLDLVHIIKKNRHVASSAWDNMVQCKVAKDACLNLNLLSINLPLDLVASLKLNLGENTCLLKHLNNTGLEIRIKDFGN